jgi:ABC-2 type transport system permease protein
MLSAVTTESRYASFAWFAIWIFGFLTHETHAAVMPYSSSGSGSIMQYVSLFHLYSDVAGWLLNSRFAVSGVETRLVLLGVLTAVSLAVVYRRVSAPMKI